MTGRVCEHPPPRVVRLLLRLACAVSQQGSLGEVEVVDLEVEVGLLRLLLSWPCRCPVVRHALKPRKKPSGPRKPAKSSPEPSTGASPVARS